MTSSTTSTSVPPATDELATSPFEIAGVRCEPGQRVDDTIRLSRSVNGDMLGIPVMILHGAFRGPVVAIQAGIHGDEYDGQQAVRELVASLDPASMHGTLLAIPCLNTAAFGAASRVSAIDQANMNRIFPGDADGTFSLRLAAYYVSTIVPVIDAMVDLHTGGQFGEITPLAIVQRGYEDMATELGLAAGHRVIWKGGSWGGTARASTLAAGKPAVTLEAGGGTYRDEVKDLHLRSITNILRFFGVIDGEAEFLERYDAVNATFSRAAVGGFYLARCEPGEVAEAGQVLAEIVDHYGTVVETITAPDAGIVLWVRRIRTINPGEETLIFGPIENQIVR
ncbi:N(2)-acetyl-L-2,4-diaminobutanoate deacetylase DoeB [soil metagenome]